jgi:hypothetical protein
MIDIREIKALFEHVVRSNPMHKKFIKNAIDDLANEELSELRAYILCMNNLGYSCEALGVAYLTIVQDTFHEELYFRSAGHYRFKTFAEAESAVYKNPSYMKNYMVGLALTSFLWPNHARIRKFFKEKLKILASRKGLYREVGPGHGMFLVDAMRVCNFSRYEGVDVSETSINMTRQIVESGFFGDFPNLTLVKRNFLDYLGGVPSSVLVMGEVLEHVENPADFMDAAYVTTTDDALVFLTTCINAPAIDHLYNPGSIRNLERLYSMHKFIVRDRLIVPRLGVSLEECEERKLPVNVAYLLTKC